MLTTGTSIAKSSKFRMQLVCKFDLEQNHSKMELVVFRGHENIPDVIAIPDAVSGMLAFSEGKENSMYTLKAIRSECGAVSLMSDEVLNELSVLYNVIKKDFLAFRKARAGVRDDSKN